MEFITIANDYALMSWFKENQLCTIIYDDSQTYYGEIYEVNSSIYIEFILDNFKYGVGHAVFLFDECSSKEELTERMPSIAEFVRLILKNSKQIKKAIVDNSVNADNIAKFQNIFQNDSNIPFWNVENFLREYLAHHCIKVQ